ncbi:hypothetical protein [Fredinandcohnia quinoae]|uniref:Uncharacterized protein n=1 Tax=Fredinandcohnia quinoae TaxID=2918902 RepID=A0AAW5E9P3_9BACI|nr:hypothetical protein [Fredinandcohnia sp. SECRCQ15]MCH1626727.1 hypothetical protein [Fredinandcohnia sp. SECRCQ15]
MDHSGLLMMAIVWGVLYIYFLTPLPFQKSTETEQHSEMKFGSALKLSVIKITFHRKAILAFILLLITLFVTWWSQVQNEIYNEIHGISLQTTPINYTVGTIVYAVIIYLLMVGRRALKLYKYI